MEKFDLDEDEQNALREIIKDRLWWNVAVQKAKQVGLIAGGFFALLAFLAMWWPWITGIVQFIIKDIPQ